VIRSHNSRQSSCGYDRHERRSRHQQAFAFYEDILESIWQAGVSNRCLLANSGLRGFLGADHATFPSTRSGIKHIGLDVEPQFVDVARKLSAAPRITADKH
jgi:hypothetical protein